MLHRPTRPFAGSHLLMTVLTAAGATFTQWVNAQQLPPASRTVYKCQEAGRVVYSDAPCLGAEKLDIQPTRGLGKSSGKELIGRDVQHERNREVMAEALRPLTGMDAKQLDRAGRRMKLTPEAQKECQALDKSIPRTEQDERLASGAERPSVKRQLLALRVRYRIHGCD
jgi:hypothetical protein